MNPFKLFFLIYLLTACIACDPVEISDLRHNFTLNDTVLSEKDLCVTEPGSGKLNYVKALYSSWNHCKIDPCEADPVRNSKMLFQALAAVGDYENMNQGMRDDPCGPGYLNRKGKTPVSYPARACILDQFKNYRVIMFNEADDRIESRVFFLTLLEDLRKAGATHLALEKLSNRSKDECIVEPIYAQIIRKAKKLGFKLIAYEDTSVSTKGDDKEKWQAVNLYEKIKMGDSLAKTVVLAGYSHISEDSMPDFKMMAWYFSVVSRTNPLTVDQLRLNETSHQNLLPRQYFDSLNKKVGESLVIDQQMMQLIYGDTNHVQYDLYIYHPKTKYIFRRPKWLVTKEKEVVAVKIPQEIKPVLVQAYLRSEIKSKEDYDFKVPIDQTFHVDKNEVHLILDKSSDYNIVFRDPENKIIHTEITSIP